MNYSSPFRPDDDQIFTYVFTIGDWGLGIGGLGVGGWGFGPNPQPPIPKSPIPNPHYFVFFNLF